MSRAFVNEDRQDFEPTQQFGLPPADDPSYDVAAALVLLEAARDGRLQAAEAATGYRWGEEHLHEHVRRLLAKEEERPEDDQDRRLVKMAKRFLRAVVVVLALAAAYPAPVATQTPPARLANTHEIDVASRQMGDRFRIQLCLPDGYGDTGFFPVVYVLDGDRTFGMACDIARWLARAGGVEPAIVVGIGYGADVDTWWRKRARDYTPTREERPGPWGDWPQAGGARVFLDFLATELIPIVDQRYRTRPGDRTLVGLSFGGLFGAWVLVTEPELFPRYVLVAPAVQWDERYVFGVEEAYAQSHSQLRARVFGAVGADDDRHRILEPWHDFVAQVEARHYRGLELDTRIYDDTGHISVFPAALADGLRTVLPGG